MCGSPQSLPRVPSCDMGAAEPREEAASLNWLLPSLHSATLAFKAFDIRDPHLSLGKQGPDGATSLAHSGPRWLINTGCASTHLS